MTKVCDVCSICGYELETQDSSPYCQRCFQYFTTETSIFSDLQFHTTNTFEQQLVKVQEEIGELIKAVKKGEGDIGDEWSDCMIAVWVLGEQLNLSREEEIRKGIKKVNNRIS